MRAIVYKMVSEQMPVQWREIFHSGGSLVVDNLPPRPFVVIRFGVFAPAMGAVQQGSTSFWVHDDPGDYDTIDQVLKAIRGIMDGAEHVQGVGGSAELIRSEWTATSDDLFDPGFRTITKNASYSLTGTGA